MKDYKVVRSNQNKEAQKTWEVAVSKGEVVLVTPEAGQKVYTVEEAKDLSLALHQAALRVTETLALSDKSKLSKGVNSDMKNHEEKKTDNKKVDLKKKDGGAEPVNGMAPEVDKDVSPIKPVTVVPDPIKGVLPQPTAGSIPDPAKGVGVQPTEFVDPVTSKGIPPQAPSHPANMIDPSQAGVVPPPPDGKLPQPVLGA